MRRRALPSLLLVLAALAAGCGGDGGGDLEAAETAFRDYFAALADGDGQRACDLMTAEAREQVEGGDCAAEVERRQAGLSDQELDALRDPQLELTLNADRAVATIGDAEVTVVKVGGEWLIDAAD